MVVICLCAVADRFHGYLRSVMLNVHPGVSMGRGYPAARVPDIGDVVERGTCWEHSSDLEEPC
jgi:CRISPR-associated protein Cas2